MSNIHVVAQRGFGTGTNELYNRARPSYQPTALAHIREELRSTPPFNIVEVGAGTGIFTRALLAHPEWNPHVKQVRAIEPSAGMRQTFTEAVHDERVSIIEGTFESTSVEDGWADIITMAQAFHWCPDYGAAAKEFARILKPNGIIAFIWNVDDRDAAAWIAQLRDCTRIHEGDNPIFTRGLWRQTFDTEAYKHAFEPPEEKTWSYILPTTLEKVVDRVNSKSSIAILPEAEKLKVQQEVKGILERGDGLTWIDHSQGIFECPHQTLVVISRKKVVQ